MQRSGISEARRTRETIPEIAPEIASEIANDLDIVPAAILEPLWPSESRNVLKREAAELLDAYLVRLARREAVGRRVLGRIAGAFLAHGRHTDLGFARAGDYARERLGISASQLYEVAQTSSRLEELPETAMAFERGQIGWTKVRELAAVAKPDTEAAWLAVAREYTADALHLIVKRAKKDAATRSSELWSAESIAAASAAAIREATGQTDGGACPAQSTVGSSGEPICEAVRQEGAEESVAAGAAKGIGEATRDARKPEDVAALLEAQADEVDGEPRVRFDIRCPRRVRRLWGRALELARRMEGGEVAAWQACEAIAAEALSTSGCDGADSRANGSGIASDSTEIGADGAGSTAACFGLGVAGPRISVLDPYARGRDNGRPCPRHLSRDRFLREAPADAGADAWQRVAVSDDFEEIDALRMTIDRRPVADALPDAIEQLGRDLGDCDARELDRRMRAALAAMQRVDWQMGRLLRVFFNLRLYLELGYLSEGAYARNRLALCSRKARGLVAIERKSWSASPALAEAYRMGSLSWLRGLLLVSVVTEATAKAWIERAGAVTFRRLRDEVEWALEKTANTEAPATVMPPEMGATLVHDAKPASEGAADDARQIRGHDGVPGFGPCAVDAPLLDARIRFEAPGSVVALLCEAMATRARQAEAPWRALERVLVEVVAFWESQPRHRDPVFERDGWRCTVPGCTSRRNLHDHHVVFRSQGGDNDRDNRITICAPHHLRGIHGGRLRAFGSVSAGVVWELGLGLGRSRGPFLRLRGDSYLPVAVSLC